jgi:hypothetical protein
MADEVNYRISRDVQSISGEDHHLIEREDGFRFYLDKAFLHVLEHHDQPGLEQDLEAFGVTREEIPKMIVMLRGAGLLK